MVYQSRFHGGGGPPGSCFKRSLALGFIAAGVITLVLIAVPAAASGKTILGTPLPPSQVALAFAWSFGFILIGVAICRWTYILFGKGGGDDANGEERWGCSAPQQRSAWSSSPLPAAEVSNVCDRCLLFIFSYGLCFENSARNESGVSVQGAGV